MAKNLMEAWAKLPPEERAYLSLWLSIVLRVPMEEVILLDTDTVLECCAKNGMTLDHKSWVGDMLRTIDSVKRNRDQHEELPKDSSTAE